MRDLLNKYSTIFLLLTVVSGTSLFSLNYSSHNNHDTLPISLKNKKSSFVGRLPTSSSAYHYAGSCISQGQWVANAHQAANQIKSYIEQLKSDENCKAIINVLENFEMPAVQPYEDGEKKAENASDLSLILTTSNQGMNENLFNVILEKSINNAFLNFETKHKPEHTKDYNNGRIKIATTGIHLLEGLMNILPQSEQCLFNNAKSSASLLSGTIKMISAYSGGEDGFLSGANKLVTSLISFLQQKQFSRIFKKIDTMDFWSSISCLVESTTENYCSTVDASEMLKFSNPKKIQALYLADKNPNNYNPLEGYLIYNREVSIITNWVQKIQFGVTPKLLTDAEYKNTILENVNDMLQFNFKLMAFVSDRSITYRSINDSRAKKGFLLDTIKAATKMIQGGSFGGTAAARGDMNFYTMNVISDLVPFYLIGKNVIPKEVAVNYQGKFVMSWESYMANGAHFQPEFDDPNNLLHIIKVRTDKIIALANESGSDYFRQRFIVDLGNLTDKALVGTGLTVKKSLYRVKRYLNRLFYKYKGNINEADLEILPSMAITANKIQMILNYFERIKNVTKRINEKTNIKSDVIDLLKENANKVKYNLDEKTLSEINKKENNKQTKASQLNEKYKLNNKKFKHKLDFDKIDFEAINMKDLASIFVMAENEPEYQQLYSDLIETVYTQFNILLQRESFLQVRLHDYIRYDYSYTTRNKINLSDYQNELLTIASTGAMENLLHSAYRDNPSLIKTELKHAQVINQNNIDSLERILSNSLLTIIRELDLTDRVRGNTDVNLSLSSIKEFFRVRGNTDVNISLSSIKEFAQDSFNYTLGSYKGFFNIFARSDRYPIILFPDIDKPLRSEDNVGSINQFKAQLCIQSLAFKDKNKFYEYCQGSRLSAYGDKIDFNGNSLSVSYDRLLNNYHMASLKSEKSFKDSEINLTCGFRNYRRRNQAFWILNKVNDLL